MAFSYSSLPSGKPKLSTLLPELKKQKNIKIIAASILAIAFFLWTLPSSSSSGSFPNVLKQVRKLKTENTPHIISDKETNYEIIDYDRDHIKYIYPEAIEQVYNSTDLEAVDWSKYAYVLYATSSAHMCNAMMIFAELRKFHTRAQLVLLVNADFLDEPWNYEYEYTTLTAFSKKFDVKLKATKVKRINDKHDVNIWISSFTKLMVFNETDYERIIYLDSDAILLNDNIDELFFIPPCKMASVTGYWLTKDRYAKQENNKYQAKDFDFKPLTKQEREDKINSLIADTVTPFTNKAGVLPINNAKDDLEFQVNQRNFHHNLYNNLPNFKFLDEFSFTNIIMVIQPSEDLFARIEESFNHRQKNEFDMDIINFYVFKMTKCLELQQQRKPEATTNLTTLLDEDIPEFLILPHQVYGTLTSEFNLVKDHKSYLADPQDQPFVYQKHLISTTDGNPAYYDLSNHKDQSAQFFSNIKYLHFSDSPIPKPWIEKNKNNDYMTKRIRCDSHPDFHQKEGEDRKKPMGTTEDCAAGEYWEKVHELFANVRWEVCQLRLKYTTVDPYTNDIN